MHRRWILRSPRGSQDGSCKQFTLLAFGTVHSGNLVFKLHAVKAKSFQISDFRLESRWEEVLVQLHRQMLKIRLIIRRDPIPNRQLKPTPRASVCFTHRYVPRSVQPVLGWFQEHSSVTDRRFLDKCTECVSAAQMEILKIMCMKRSKDIENTK